MARLPAGLARWARRNWNRGRHGPEPADPFHERVFDRAALRAPTPAVAAHVLLSGFGAAPSGPSSAGSLLGLTLGSAPVLRGPDETAEAAYPFSAVELARDSRYVPPPMVAALDGALSVGGIVAAAVTVLGYNGARWRRHVILLSPTALLLVDEIEAELAGNYDMTSHLHTTRPVVAVGALAAVRRTRYSVDIRALGGQAWHVLDDDATHIAVTAAISLGVSEAVCTGVSIAVGEAAAPPLVRAQAVSDSTFRVEGLPRGPVAIAVAGDARRRSGCEIDARSLVMLEDLIAVVGATRFAAASSYVESSDPVDLVVHPAQGRVLATSHTGSQVFLGFGRSRTEVELRPGQRWEHDLLLPPNLAEMMLADASAPSGGVPRRADRARPSIRRAASDHVPVRPLQSVAAGEPVAAGMSPEGLAFALRCGRLEVHRGTGPGASYALVSRPTCLAVGSQGIAVGGESGAIQCFADGVELWRHPGIAYREAPQVTALASHESPDGPRVLVGTKGGAVYSLDRHGRPLWAADQAAEAVTCLGVVARPGAEMPGAGICATTHSVRVFDLGTGARKCSLLSPGVRVTRACLCSAAGGSGLLLVTRCDGRLDALSVGALMAADYPRLQCSPQWSVELAARPTNVVALATDGSETLAVACETGWLVWMAPTGAVLRRDRLGRRIMALATCEGGLIAVARDGEVVTVDLDGALVGSFSLDAPPRECVPLDNGGMVIVLPSAVVHVGQPGRIQDDASR